MRKWIDLFESAEEHEFERLVWELRNKYAPDFEGNCETAAADLSERLTELGIPHKVMQGMYDCHDGEVQAERSSHVWVEIDGYILDPTAEQFGTDETVIPMTSEATWKYEGDEVLGESLVAWGDLPVPLAEAFDNAQDYKWFHEDQRGDVLEVDWARFHLPNERHGQVDFFRRDDTVKITFSVDASEQITGQGDAFPIFATVLKIIHEFIANHADVKTLRFDATTSETSRLKLYRAMIRSLVQDGWYTDERSVDNGELQQFILTRE